MRKACWDEALLRHRLALGVADRTAAAVLHAMYCLCPFSTYMSRIPSQVISLLVHGGLLCLGDHWE